ncbi:MAG: putative glycosyltransferase, partial [Dehalococcoidia bacterium]|nr:putative glycosyltransferase [Dehalococcoidia bacterium]
MASFPKVSVVIVCTNELKEIKECIPPLLEQSYSNYEVLLMDNGSTDGSPEYVEANFGGVKVIRNRANLGYAGANNRGFQYASGEYIAVLNPDTVVERDWLKELVKAMEENPSVGLATSKICHLKDKSRINTCGNDVHFTGLAFCRGLDLPRGSFSVQEYVPAISGCAFVIRKSVLERVGGFDESFFMYLEDTDLSLRARLAGFDCLYVPSSVVYHDYDFNPSQRKFYHLERNRLLLLLRNYRWRTLALMLPALIITDLLTWGYALISGGRFLSGKARAYLWVLSNFSEIMDKRGSIQMLRKEDDRDLLKSTSFRIPFEQLTSVALFARVLGAIINPIM